MLSQDSKEKAIPTLLPGNFVFGESSMNGVVISYMPVSYTHLDVYKRQT